MRKDLLMYRAKPKKVNEKFLDYLNARSTYRKLQIPEMETEQANNELVKG